MSLSKQAKTLTTKQVGLMINYLSSTKSSLRNQVIFLLSIKAGLRAKEIALLSWDMLVDSDGKLTKTISLTNIASKGSVGGRKVPINKLLQSKLEEYFALQCQHAMFGLEDRVITTQRSKSTSSQAIVNMFSTWYRDLQLVGCSSHSGRRTFITNCSRKISIVGGSLRDVQMLAGHSSLQTTQRYIDWDSESQRKVVDLL